MNLIGYIVRRVGVHTGETTEGPGYNFAALFVNRKTMNSPATTSFKFYITLSKFALKEARKDFFGCHSVCETMKDTKEGYFIV